eukprot:738531-Pleurochrysis_carterae.AAC.1
MVAENACTLAHEPFPANLRDPQPGPGEGRRRAQRVRRRLPPAAAAPTTAETKDGAKLEQPPGDVAIAQLFLPGVYESQ